MAVALLVMVTLTSDNNYCYRYVCHPKTRATKGRVIY